MTPELPSPSAFLADFGIAAPPKEGVVEKSHEQVRQEVQAVGVSPEMFDLLVQYCAQTLVYELEEVNWEPLARRLGTRAEYLKEAAHAVNAEGERLWRDVLSQRIKRVSAAKVFRDASWERLEATAVTRLLTLAEKGMIRDTGELLAIASHSRKANTAPAPSAPQGATVNINFGGDSMTDENGLPGAGAKMTIDLTPRLANSLSQRRTVTEAGNGRVIDGQMLSAQELRDALTKRNAVESTEGDADE